MNITPEEEDFIRRRSRATADHFDRFVAERDLDLDFDSWPEQDRADFRQSARALVEEWKDLARKEFGV